MKKIINLFSIFLLIMVSFILTGCDMLDGVFGENSSNKNVEEYDKELESSTGKWLLQDDEDTYFTFDGSKNVMKDSLTPITFIFTRNDKENEDWIGCYVEDFDSDFTQFTIMTEEEDLGMIDASIHTHIYRISELPYKMGCYILEGNKYKNESDDYKYSSDFNIPSGTYNLETGESFTFFYTKPGTCELFQYVNGEVMVEGVITIAEDKKTIYLYIENDPYNKVTNTDKEHYDTTFGIYYPPDFYLRGDFSNSNYIVINDLYHHTERPSKVEESTWEVGTYNKRVL